MCSNRVYLIGTIKITVKSSHIKPKCNCETITAPIDSIGTQCYYFSKKQGSNKILGYIWGNSKEQNSDRQNQAFLEYGIDERDITEDMLVKKIKYHAAVHGILILKTFIYHTIHSGYSMSLSRSSFL